MIGGATTFEVVGGAMHLYMNRSTLTKGATSSQSMRLRQPTCPPCTGTPAYVQAQGSGVSD
jgi:hypothetical protein